MLSFNVENIDTQIRDCWKASADGDLLPQAALQWACNYYLGNIDNGRRSFNALYLTKVINGCANKNKARLVLGYVLEHVPNIEYTEDKIGNSIFKCTDRTTDMPEQVELPGCWSEWNKKPKASPELDMEKLLKLANSIVKRISKCEDEDVSIAAFKVAMDNAAAKLPQAVESTKVDHKAESIEGETGVTDTEVMELDEAIAHKMDSYTRADFCASLDKGEIAYPSKAKKGELRDLLLANMA